jgi:alpha-beta hydrolase superfamily lysophospholipase
MRLLNRREAITGLAGSALAAGSVMAVDMGSATPVHAQGAGQTTYVLVHGAWHNALHWSEVAARLASTGADVVAVNLPGHGLKAQYPKSILTQDQAATA